MYLPDFDYYAPESLTEATGLLMQLGPSAMVLAGGTDILAKMKNGVLAPSALVSLKNLHELRRIRWDADRGLAIGALATHNEICNSAVVQEHFLSLAEAAHKLANNQVRNRGTIGGNLVNAIPSADLPPILIALGAYVTLTGPDGSRTLPVESFFTGVSCCALKPEGEILTEVVIPPPKPGLRASFEKLRPRGVWDFAMASMAMSLQLRDKTIDDARVVFGGISGKPLRETAVETFLKGKTLSADLGNQAVAIALANAAPLKYNATKIDMAKGLLASGLAKLNAAV